MNFFEQQDRAKRNSGRLVLLLMLAVASLIALTSLVLGVIWHVHQQTQRSSRLDADVPFSLLPSWPLVGLVAFAVIGVVVLGSLYKSAQLSGGGKVVAERLGGRLLNLAPQSLEERRLLNVVEEMAIAAGTPVPPVYVLNDPGINAFAAGLTPQDAVIGITRGAICLLSREQLQGVIAHEFSHIFHGDMRLNIRLVSLLHGILLLGLIGEVLLQSSDRSSYSDRDRSKGGLLMIGGTLWILGYTGTFFGNLIKAAVSRQREFLADASAVQFTRNPDSIAGALKKIGGSTLGSRLQAGHAAEFSHMYFAAGIRQAMDGLMATHPLLDERIRRIEPAWDGSFPRVNLSEVTLEPAERSALPAEVTASWQQALGAPAMTAPFSEASVEQAISAIGDPQPAHLQQARSALLLIGEPLRQAAHSFSGAQALAYGLMLAREPAAQARQLALLKPHLEVEVAEALDTVANELLLLADGLRLPLLELAIPVLKQLAKDQWATLQSNLILLAKADRKIDLLEWTLLRILQRNVEGPRPLNGKYHLLELADESAVLLSALAHAGHADAGEADHAFAAARALLPFDRLPFVDKGMPTMQALDGALNRLNLMWPLQKPRLLKALARCVEHDGHLTAAEAELIRAVADVLDCPMPPLLVA
ncbi:M48 family metallopeptidase [Pseudomonas borbori]